MASIFSKILALVLLSSTGFALSTAIPAVETQFDSVIFYTATAYDESDGSETFGLCNGQLLSSRVMVTAAHCVIQVAALKKTELDMQPGEYIYRERNGEIIRIGYAQKNREKVESDIYFLPAVNERLKRRHVKTRLRPHDDLAVVVFKRDLNVRSDMKFIEVISQEQLQRVLPQMMQHRPQVVSINPVEEMSLDTRRRAFLDKVSMSWLGGHLSSTSIARVAPGDSGSPFYFEVDGEIKLAGVVKGRANNLLMDWDVYGLLDSKICDISQQIPEVSIQNLLCK